MIRRRPLGLARKLLRCRKNRVVEGVNFLGNGDERPAASRAPRLEIRIGTIAIHMHIAALPLGRLLNGISSSLPVALVSASTAGTRALCAPVKPGPLLRAVVVGENRDLIVRRQTHLEWRPANR